MSMPPSHVLRDWARTKDVVGLRRIAKDAGMLHWHGSRKPELIDWLMVNRSGFLMLAESYTIETEALRGRTTAKEN